MMPSRENFAIHEAGHAVACIRLDVEVKCATIKPREGDEGHVKNKNVTCDGDFVWNYSPEAVSRVERLMVITLAGPFAQKHFAGGMWKNPSDYREVRKWIEHSKRDDWECYEKEMEARADELVMQNSPEIKLVAQRLIERQTLSGEEIRAAMLGGTAVMTPSEPSTQIGDAHRRLTLPQEGHPPKATF